MTRGLWPARLGHDGHADGELLSALADGELGFDHPAGRHAVECPRCLTEIEAFRVIRQDLRRLPAVGLPGEWEEQLIARVATGGTAYGPAPGRDTPASVHLGGVRRRAALVAAAVASIAAAVTLSVLPKSTPVKPPMARFVVRHVTSSAGEDPSRLAPGAVPASFGR